MKREEPRLMSEVEESRGFTGRVRALCIEWVEPWLYLLLTRRWIRS
jgi:hypothetical protein